MKIVVLIFAILCIWLKLVMGVTLTFDASPSPQVGYVLKWGNSSNSVIGSMALDTNRVAVLTNGPWGAYYFKVTAFSNNGLESDPSNVLLATNLPYAPLNLRLVPSTNVIFLDGSIDAGQTWSRLANITNNKPVTIPQTRQQMLRTLTPPLPH